MSLGAGDDLFIWNPIDGGDVVEGQDGLDRFILNGAAVNENIVVSANGGRVSLTRDVGNVLLDLDDVERLDLNVLAGADVVTVNNLAGTDLTHVNINLAAARAQ